VHMLRDALAKVDPSDSWETEPAHNSSDGFASHVLTTFRLGVTAEQRQQQQQQ